MKFDRGTGYWTFCTLFELDAEPESQREHWYRVTPYIAEFWCTVSNVPFFLVAWHYGCWQLWLAAIASVLSHAIPKQFLLTVDKCGVLLVLSKLVFHHTVLFHHPWVILLVGMTFAINVLDTHLARQFGWTWPHIVWHVSSATVAAVVLDKLA